MKLILMVGPPGSGKSTYAKNYKFGSPEIVIVNQDSQGKDGHMSTFLQAIAEGKEIIVDRMGFSKEQRERYLGPAKANGYKTEIIVFHVPYQKCMERCIARLGYHETIKNQKDASKALNFFFSKYERVEDNEADVVYREYSSKSLLGGTHEVKPAIICDIDGTLANIDHRLHFVKNGNKNWKDFFFNMKYDEVYPWCHELLQRFEPDYQIILASGRPDDHRGLTLEWLSDKNVHFDDLHMRRRGDFRQDNIVKEIIYEFEIKTRYKPLFVVDDRKQVVDMWRKHGLTVLACAEGEF